MMSVMFLLVDKLIVLIILFLKRSTKHVLSTVVLSLFDV